MSAWCCRSEHVSQTNWPSLSSLRTICCSLELWVWEQLSCDTCPQEKQACHRDDDKTDRNVQLLANKYHQTSLLNLTYLPLRSRRSEAKPELTVCWYRRLWYSKRNELATEILSKRDAHPDREYGSVDGFVLQTQQARHGDALGATCTSESRTCWYPQL